MSKRYECETEAKDTFTQTLKHPNIMRNGRKVQKEKRSRRKGYCILKYKSAKDVKAVFVIILQIIAIMGKRTFFID